ncbi:DNA polymerase III subunit delta' [Pseudoalteromonas sp. MMG022]|uniref:DNA polymerase III subunit delta' n=1 Tax=Pseudoalteromonas sp. MMG022 TaxID=2909978 RepID=UPI001F001C50|nr:DNA polymerase III subunit delta' [Pseudoalteromonas sp. MMG022]MCF6434222.1 DNA polymerase III subunit delta' [Pseudoalteromonas sp. MMG022]
MYQWHEGLWQYFRLSQQQGRFHHAQLFHGPSGVGKQELAKQLAQAILCEQHQQLTACGMCKSCLLIAAQTHPDLLCIAPQGQSISVDAIRELADFVHHSAQQGGRKVAVIANAHKMTHSAANALLKTLEEPNTGRYLLLTSDDLSQLSATILSRCNKVQVTVTDPQHAQQWLQNMLPQEQVFPWLTHFAHQPLKIAMWFNEGVFEKVDLLYRFACGIKASHNFNQVQGILNDHPELLEVFCVFMQQKLKAKLLEGLSYQAYSEGQAALNQFMSDTRQILGLNQSLGLNKLMNTIKNIIE